MRQTKFHFVSALLLTSVLALACFAQDAQQVLRLSVSFRTMKNTAQMDEATRKTVGELEAKARAATIAQKYGEALKHYSHAMVLMRKQEWTPLRAFNTALQIKLDKLIYDPGETARLKLTQSYTLDEPVPGKLSLTLTLVQTREGKQQIVKELKTLNEVSADFSKETAFDVALPLVPVGNYQLLLALTPKEGEPLKRPTTIRIEQELNAKANQIAHYL